MPRLTKLCMFLLILCTNFLYGYDYLTVQDPKNTWRYGQGSIDEATISIRPMGLYMEYGIYLTFSAKSYYSFSASDTVEVQFFFDLPKEAIMHDMWLWVGNDIMKANILDQWTASSIYENIVKRRRDPAILFKRGQSSYELRVYPMAGNQTRKVKLTYMVPCQWLPNMVTSPLPMNLLRTSYTRTKLNILYWPDSKWTNPRLLEFPSAQFTSYNDPQYSNYMKVTVPDEAINSSLNFAVDSPMKNGIFLSRYENNTEGLYQLAFVPSQVLGMQAARKTAIVLDYDASKSTLDINKVIDNLKTTLRSNFSAKDSFNLIYSQQLSIKRASNKWISADSLQIEKYFADLIKNSVSTYSNLPLLLHDAVSFIKENGNDASIVLVSDADQSGDYRVANTLIEDLMKNMSPVLPVNIIDYENTNYSYYYTGGRSYYGNEYFYENITRLTNGIYNNLRQSQNQLPDILTTTLQSLSGFIGSFDLSTTLQSGYCFGRFNITSIDPSVYLNRPILQIGKYKGSFPFNVQVSGVYKSQVFSNKLSLQEATANTPSDSLLEEVWAGNYIKSLEAMTQNNNIINQVIDFSKKNRVISLYTAFLALEPSDTVKACTDCLDETKFTDVKSIEAASSDTLQMKAYPNPFNSQTVIKIRLPQVFDEKNASMKIYNVLGREVKTFELKDLGNNRSMKLNWNGRDNSGQNVSSGIYFFVLTTQTERHSLKLLLLK
ncbi:MAG: VIT domain-containing protein [Bacteroidota bacterium]|nr:VIT domain-containing protein [Bacteroidota bacterium]